MKAAGIEKGTPTPGKKNVGQITLKQLYAIAQIKQNDQNRKVGARFAPALQALYPPLPRWCSAARTVARSVYVL